MEFVLWVVFGIAAGALSIGIARAMDQERAIFGAALIIAGAWYVAFGVHDGRNLNVLLPQILGGSFFVLCGLAGMRHSVLFLSLGWLFHAAWDFASPLISDVSYMPGWTAPACLGFDVLIGGYLFLRFRNWHTITAKTTEAMV